MRMRLLGKLLAISVALGAALPTSALGGQTARISARFAPEHLAAATTVSFGSH
jgi:hypothetical protein